MASSKTTGLPKRFQPFLQQALTEADLRYGAQEATFGTVLGQLGRDRDRQLLAQKTAQQSLLGSLQQSDNNVNRYYSDSGLSPTVLSSLAGTPTGARLAGEMASYRAQNQQGILSAQAGGQYQQQRINQDYGDKRQTLVDQLNAEQKERGTFTSSALDQLISGDRSARSQANALARKQAHDDAQAILDRQTQQDNALIGQGLIPDAHGNLQPLPGGNADPNAPQNQPKPKKRTTGPGTASPDAQLSAGTAFKNAVAFANGMVKGRGSDPAAVSGAQRILANGKDASKGKAIYETVPVLDARGQPKLDANNRPVTKQVKAVWKKGEKDPATGLTVDESLVGTAKTTAPRAAIPKFDAPIANAAVEQAAYGYVTTKTVRELQKLGYSVNQIPGLKTENQYRASQPKTDQTLPMGGRTGTAKSRDQQLG